MEYIKKFEIFSVNVSSLNYKQLLVGEGIIHKDGRIMLRISTNPKHSGWDARGNPSHDIDSDIFDKSLSKIPGMDVYLDYVFKKNLLDVIVEFHVFNETMGSENEQVVIWELRTHY